MNMSSHTLPCKGEVWVINFNPTVGSEIQKARPAVIVSEDSIGKLPLRIVVPVTDWKEKHKKKIWMTKLKMNLENGLTKDSGADSFQVKSVSLERFQRKLGYVTAMELRNILDAVALCIGV